MTKGTGESAGCCAAGLVCVDNVAGKCAQQNEGTSIRAPEPWFVAAAGAGIALAF